MKWCLPILLALVLGCTSIREVMESWIGSSANQLYSSWGAPNTIASDGHGGQILTYTQQHSYTTPRYTPYYQTDAYAAYTYGGQTYHRTSIRTFWIDSDEIIYRVAWR